MPPRSESAGLTKARSNISSARTVASSGGSTFGSARAFPTSAPSRICLSSRTCRTTGTSGRHGCGPFRRRQIFAVYTLRTSHRLNVLDDLAAGSSLEELAFGNAVWVTSSYATLDPLAGLGQLRDLNFSAKRILDGRIQPLASLTKLETLSFPTNLFTTEQCAWLRARLPNSATGRVLEPLMKLDKPLVSGKDTLVIGKRKPWLNSATDRERIAGYEARFWQLVEEFRDSSSKEPRSRPQPR